MQPITEYIACASSRGRVNTGNRNLWQEDYGVGKLNNSNATHLLTS